MKKRSLTFMLLTAMMWLLGSNAWAIEQDAKGVYQIATAQDLADFAGLVNSGQKTINGAITADIDYTGQTAIIGSATGGIAYAGTLDGQGHTVTIDLVMSGIRQALISYTSASAVIRNLCVDGTITAGYARAAGIVSYNCGLVENCAFLGTINSSVNGESTHAGICGSCNEGSVVRNCLFAGKITGADTQQVGGIVGWINTQNSAAVTIENCLSIGDIDVKSNAHVIACSPKPTVLSNTYYQEGTSLAIDATAKAVTSEDLASGKFAYEFGWGQNLGTDKFPSPVGKPTVYAVGRKHCDGSDYEGITYNNVGGAAPQDEHILVDGICSVCGQLPADSEGYLLLSTASALKKFAQMVNAGQGSLKAKLTADIDYSGETTLIGSAIKGIEYNGIFDGQGHTVTVNFTMPEARTALICNTQTKAVVRNLIVDGTITAPLARAAGIVAYNRGLVENCTFKGTIDSSFSGSGTHGGICGSTNENSTIRNCLFSGKIIAPNANQCAGIIGWVNTSNGSVTIENCLNIGEVNVADAAAQNEKPQVIACNPGGAKMINNYYQGDFSGVQVTGATALASEDLASGKAAFLLGWGQKIGTDLIPVPHNTTDVVYQYGTTNCDGTPSANGGYSNENLGNVQTPHNLVDGICSVCGQLPADEEGYLQLSTASALKLFAQKVNAGQGNLKGKLTADIDYTGESTIIGSAVDGKAFSGTLDGQGHTVTIDLVMNNVRQALVSYTSGAAIVRNLIVDGTITAGYARAAGIVAYNCGLVENCVFKGTINSSVDGESTHAGICGSCNEGSVIRNCIFAGKITGDKTKQVGGMVGWINTTKAGTITIENCLNIGDIDVLGDAHVMACNPNPAIIRNCYYIEGSTLVKDHDAKELASEDIANGKAASLLAWGQNLGIDAMPSPLCKTAVYAVGDAGYATMVATEDTKLNGNAKAYIGAKQGNYLTLTEVADVPAGQAVVLKGTYYNKVACTATADCSANELVAATSAVAADGTQYILGNVDDTVGFYKATGTIPAGKGYLVSAAGVKAFFFGDTATAIEGMTTDNGQQTTVIYNLAGQRLQKMQKGVNIVNGKKVMY